jgi:ABC superfamily ATP binding cassette transporter, membrane protein
MLNSILLKLINQGLLSSEKLGFWGLVILMNWQLVGYMMVIYIAGLQNVPPSLIEAAEIDGASKWTILKNVTIPMVMPSITICTFLSLTNSFKLYDQNLALTAGAPLDKTEMLAMNIVKTMFSRVGFEGVGQAKAVVFFIIVAIIAYVQLKFTRNKEVEE